ncbi:MAG: MMPL family transporter [Candidatus Sericytochromatia bacterium]
MHGLFARLTPGLQRWRWLILGVWLLLLAASLLNLRLNPRDNLETEIDGAPGTSAWQVRELVKHDFQRRLGSSAALVAPAEADLTPLVRELPARFPQVAELRRVLPQEASAHPRRQQLWVLEFQPELQLVDTQALTTPLRQWLKTWAQRAQTEILVTGNTAFQHDAKLSSAQESHRSEVVALCVSLVILILNFGSLPAALLPLAMGASSLILLNSLIRLLGLSVNPISRILASLVGLALGIDYALFLVSRFREELRQRPASEALRVALTQTGPTILFSGLIMLCSLAALLLPNVSISRTAMGQLLLVVVISLVHALLLLPALLALSPRWLNWPSGLSQRVARLNTEHFWRRFSETVVRHWRWALLGSLLLLGALAWPATRLRLWEPVQAVSPLGSESRLGYERLVADGWGGELLPVVLVLKSPSDVYDPAYLARLYSLTRLLEKQPEVARVQSLVSGGGSLSDYQALYRSVGALGFLGASERLAPLVNLQNGSNLSLVYVFPRDALALDDTRQILKLARAQAAEIGEDTLLVGGVVARVQDFTYELYRYTPWMLLLIVGGVYVLLWRHMGTLVLPLKAAVMNFLPIVASFGVLTLIFQEGWLQSWLHTPFNGAVTNTVPIVLFCLVFGLSMDYEVLILSRISEEYARSGNVRQAVIEGLARSGSVITGAVLILLGVFIPGCFSASPQTQEICIGITVAILLDATVVRLLLVPSFMLLLGRYNWWHPGKKTPEHLSSKS